jgi:hypothetical protein
MTTIDSSSFVSNTVDIQGDVHIGAGEGAPSLFFVFVRPAGADRTRVTSWFWVRIVPTPSGQGVG